MHEVLKQKIDEASAKHERARRALMRDDGRSKYSIPEYEELDGVARNEFHSSLSRIEDEIDGRVSRAEERLLRLEHRDPSSVLTGEELEQANLRHQFIGDEIFSLSPEGLEQRIRAVIASGDRPAAFVYANLIRNLASDAEFSDSPTGVADRLRLEGLVKELERALDPDLAGKIEATREEITELQKIREHAYYTRHGAKDGADLYLRQTYGA